MNPVFPRKRAPSTKVSRLCANLVTAALSSLAAMLLVACGGGSGDPGAAGSASCLPAVQATCLWYNFPTGCLSSGTARLWNAMECGGTSAGTTSSSGGNSTPAPVVIKATLGSLARVAVYNPAVPNGQCLPLTVTPSPIPNAGRILLQLSTTSGMGSAVFDSTLASSMNASQSMSVCVRGVSNSEVLNNIKISAYNGSALLATSTFSVRTWPTNFHRTTPAAAPSTTLCDGTPDGVLHFDYAWDSESGNVADLHGLVIGEWVQYPGTTNYFYPPSPPWGNTAYTDNPAIKSLEIGVDTPLNSMPDTQKNIWGFAKNYSSDVFIANQTYWFRDPVFMTSPFNWSDKSSYRILPGMGPYYIRRNIFQDGVAWAYRVEKDGCAEQVNLP